MKREVEYGYICNQIVAQNLKKKIWVSVELHKYKEGVVSAPQFTLHLIKRVTIIFNFFKDIDYTNEASAQAIMYRRFVLRSVFSKR